MVANPKIVLSLIAALAMYVHTPSMQACTDFLVTTEDKAAINGRSMEFGIDMESKIVIHPRGEERSSSAPNGQKGIKWTSQYGFIGLTAFDLDCAVDGMNEKGLSVGALWLPNSQYATVAPQDYERALIINEVGNWILGNFTTVGEVKKALENVVVWAQPIAQIDGIPPLHLAIHDAQGASLVVEFIKGEKKFYNNRVAVLTNAPEFNWHMQNLGNYVNLKAMSAAPVNLNGTVLSPPGQGSGLLGIPGDWMPPSRFVRIVAFKEFAEKPKDAKSGVNLAFHLLNTVDIPFGGNRTETKNGVSFDYTQWIVVKDLTNKCLYFRTYDDLNIRSVDLTKANLQKGAPVRTILMDTPKNNNRISGSAEPAG